MSWFLVAFIFKPRMKLEQHQTHPITLKITAVSQTTPTFNNLKQQPVYYTL